MKILFVSHSATRTGAPLMLLYFLKWLKISHPEISFDLLVLGEGDLKADFKKIALNYFEKIGKRESITSKILRKLKISTNIVDRISKFNYDIIYANSVVSLKTSIQIRNRYSSPPKLICHVHELNLIIELLARNFQTQSNFVDYFIAASDKVNLMLNKDFGICSTKIATIYEFSGLNLIPFNVSLKPKSEFVVGGSGTGHWRKGTDLFILVANWVVKNHPEMNIKFKWIGSVQYPDSLILKNDIDKLGLTNNIEFVDDLENPHNEFSTFKVFLLTSREDPFPLVAIEVGQIGVPIVCFTGSTGTEEVLINGGGRTVPYLDIEEMGKQIIFYFNNENIRRKDSEEAKILFSRFVPDLISPEIHSVIKGVYDS